MQSPAPATNVFIPKKSEHQPPAARKHSSKRQTVKLTVWLKPPVYEEIQRIAGHTQLSLSKIGATALEEWVHQRISKQHETLLYPIIRQIIREELRSFGNRIVFFLMRIAFAAEQSRILLTNILDRLLRLLNAPEQTFTTLVDQRATKWHSETSSTNRHKYNHFLMSGKDRFQIAERKERRSMANGNCQKQLCETQWTGKSQGKSNDTLHPAPARPGQHQNKSHLV